MEPCAATVKGHQRSSLGLHTASAGNNVRSSINLLCHKLAPVRALASFFGSNTDIFRPIISVFKLPDEIILSILSHISPDPWLAGDYARFCIPYCVDNSVCHHLWVQFLRPLSMTCRAMRLRLLPWVWERRTVWGGLEASPWLLRTTRNFNEIVLDAFRTNPVLATSVRYFCTTLCPQTGVNWSPLMKVRDRALSRAAGWAHPPFVRQMPEVPPESTHAGGRTMGRRHHDDPAQESAHGCQTSAD